MDKPTMSRYQDTATQVAFYPGQGTPLGVAYCALKLNGEAGELAEHVGKAMRDDGYVVREELTPARKLSLIREMGDVMWYLAALCNELDIRMEQVAYANLNKLSSRSERGTLSGSGDNR